MLRHFILISLLVLCGLESTKAQSSIDPLKARCFELGFEAIEEFEDILCAPNRRPNEFPGCITAIAPSQALRLDRCNDFDWLAWQLIWDEDVYSRADENIAIISLCTAPNLENPSVRDTLALKFNFDITRLQNGSDSICMRSVATQEIIGFDGKRENSVNSLYEFEDAPRSYSRLNKAYRLTRNHYLNDVETRIVRIVAVLDGEISLQQLESIRNEMFDLQKLNQYMVFKFDRAAFSRYKNQIDTISFNVETRIKKLESLRKAEIEADLERGFELAECGQLLEAILLLRPIVESDDFKDNEKIEEFERIDQLESLERRGKQIVEDNRTDEYLDQELQKMPREWQHFFRGLLFFSKSQAKTVVGKPDVVKKHLDSAYVNCEQSIRLKPCFIPSAQLRIDVNRAYDNLDIPHWREAQAGEGEEALTVWSDQVLPEMIRDYRQVCTSIAAKEGILKAKEAHSFFTGQSQPFFGLQVLEATLDTASIRKGDERMTRFSLYYISQLIEVNETSKAKKWMEDLKKLLPDLNEQDDYLKQTVLIAITEGSEAVESSIRRLRTEIGNKANDILDQISKQIEVEADEFKKRGLHQTAYFHLKRDPVLITQQTNSPEKLELLGDYALNANFPEEADSIWTAALELFTRKEDQTRIQVKIAQALLEAGMEVRNSAELTAIAKDDKASSKSKLVYLRYLGTDKSLSAKKFYKSIRKDPDFKDQASLKAEARYIYLAQALGKSRAGLGAMERWQEELNTSESLFELACAHLGWHPKNERIFDLKGVGKQNIDEAESLFMACLKAKSQKPSEWLIQRYLGYLTLRKGQSRDAIEHFTRATSLEPAEHIEIHLELIRLHFANQEFEKAMEVWDRLEDKSMLTCINGDEESLAFRLLTKILTELPVPQKRLLFFNKSTNERIDRSAIEPYRRCLKKVDRNDGVMKTLATLTYKALVQRSQSCGTEINAFDDAVQRLNAPIDLVNLKALSSTPAIQEMQKRFPAFDVSWKALENKQKQLLKK